MQLKKIITCVCLLITFVDTTSTAQKIGLLMDSYLIDRWHLDQKLFTDRVNELGGEVVVEVAYGDPAEQLRLGKKLITDGIKALVIIAADAKKAAEIVAIAKQAKIPVIAYDRLIFSKDLSFYISYNNLKAGNLQAAYAINKIPKGNYLLLNGPTRDNNAILFRTGQLNILQTHISSGDIKIIGDIILNDWSEIEALMKVDAFISSGKGKPDAIIAANDAIASGTLQSLPKDMVGKVILTGQDADLVALKNIIIGNQSMTIYKPIKPMAFQAAEISIKLAKKEEIKSKIKFKHGDFEVDAILLEPLLVDKSNYQDTVVKDGHVSLSVEMEKK